MRKRMLSAAALLLFAGVMLIMTGFTTVETVAFEIAPPAPGQPVPTEPVCSTAAVTWSAVRWNDTDTGAIAGHFEPGHQYALTVYGIAPEKGYAFADNISVTMNGKACGILRHNEAGAGDAYSTLSASIVFDRLADGTMITVHGSPVSKKDYLDDVYFTLDNCGSTDVPAVSWSKPSGAIELGEQFLPGSAYTATLTYPLPEGVHLADGHTYIYIDAPGSTAFSTAERNGEAVTTVTYTVAPAECLISITSEELFLALAQCEVTIDGAPVEAVLSCTVLEENGSHEMAADENFRCDSFDPGTNTGTPQYCFTVRFPASVTGPDGINVTMAAPYKIASKTVSETEDGTFVTVTTAPATIRVIPVVIGVPVPAPYESVVTTAEGTVTVDGAPVDALFGWKPAESARTPETEEKYMPGVSYRGEATFAMDKPDYRFWLNISLPDGFIYIPYKCVSDDGNCVVYSASFYYTIPEPIAALEVSAGCTPLAGMKTAEFDPRLGVALTDLNGEAMPVDAGTEGTVRLGPTEYDSYPEVRAQLDNGVFQAGYAYTFRYPLSLPETVTNPRQIICTMPGFDTAPAILPGNEPGQWILEVSLTAVRGVVSVTFDPVPVPGMNASDIKVTASYGWSADTPGGAPFTFGINRLRWDETDELYGTSVSNIGTFEAGRNYSCFLWMQPPAEIGDFAKAGFTTNAGTYMDDLDFIEDSMEWTSLVYFFFEEDGTLSDHLHSWESVKRTEATCQKAGEETFECTVCHQTMTETIEKKSHKVDHWNYSGDGKHSGMCRLCGQIVSRKCSCKTEISSGGHTLTCAICGNRVSGDHAWRLVSRTEATCEKEGELVRECSECHKKEREIIKKLSHDVKSWGATGSGQHAGKCSLCGEIILRDCTYKYETDFETHTRICTVCGDRENFKHKDSNHDGWCDACGHSMPVN